MINVVTIKVDEKKCLGLRVKLPESPPLLLLIGDKGFVMCGFLNVDAAESLGVAAATVSQVNSVENLLDAQIKAVTFEAEKLGVKERMKGIEALRHML